jgi:hypothetical protein
MQERMTNNQAGRTLLHRLTGKLSLCSENDVIIAKG